MSRTPGVTGLIDVRTTAILQDYVVSTNPCAPGAVAAVARRQRFGLVTLLENCEPPACGFDRSKDMISIVGVFVVIATAIGVMHTMALFIPTASIEYGAGYLELSLVAAMTHLTMALTTCASGPIIEYAGHRLTTLFGMMLMFVGILLDSQAFEIGVLYAANIFLVGVGAGMAYAASMTLPSDLFRAKLATAALLVAVAGSVGTIFYTWFIIEVIDVLGYKWTKLVLSILVLFFTLAVHVYPKTRLMYATSCVPTSKGVSKETAIRECVYKVAEEEKQKKNECDQEKNCLCVCVCDLRLYGDRSFLLWATLFMVATINFETPYMSIVSFAESVGIPISPWYITCYCIASIGARCAFVTNPDFTFAFNRSVFQGCIAFSGIMWIVISWVNTSGWLLVCCVMLGVVEGTLCVVASRVGIGTIPRQWIGGAWIACILCSAFGIFGMEILNAVISMQTLQYYVAFISAGVMQIIVAFLAILLPNEEDEGDEGSSAQNQDSKFTSIQSRAYTLGGGGYNCCTGYTRSYDFRSAALGSYRSSCCSSQRRYGYGTDCVTTKTKCTAYKCDCPICSKVGCIPECLPPICAPAGSLEKQMGTQFHGSTRVEAQTEVC